MLILHEVTYLQHVHDRDIILRYTEISPILDGAPADDEVDSLFLVRTHLKNESETEEYVVQIFQSPIAESI